MKHPLEQKLIGLRQRARLLLLLYGASAVVAAGVTAAVLFGVLDYFIHFQDRGIRVICTLTFWSVICFTAYRYLWPGLRAPLSDLDIALRIERRFPALSDALSSTVEFLKQSETDPQSGSPVLRRAVIAKTTAELESLDLRDVIEPRATVKVAIAAAGICLLTVGLILVRQEEASVAAIRLLAPWGNHAWPQMNHLRFEDDVTRVARGQPFEVRLRDAGGRLPGEVYIQYRDPKQPDAAPEVDRMQLAEAGVMFARREAVSRAFEYRAVGGDDQNMPWRIVEVVDPPELHSLVVELEPPAYTGRPKERADRHIHALKGTVVTIRGGSTKRLSSATLRMEGQPDQRITLDADRTGFSTQFTVDDSGAYWFRLKDSEGFLGGADRRYEVRAIPDEDPSVLIEEPGTNIYVTTRAVVPVKVVAKDDLGIQNVELRYTPSDEPERGIALYPSMAYPARQNAAGTANSLGADHRELEYAWDLSSLELQPGSLVVFYALATDYQPRSGKSQLRRLNVVSQEELADRIAGRQSVILSELSRILKLQEESRRQTGDLEVELRQVGTFDKQDHDHLQGAELTQRQVKRGLISPEEGVKSMIEDLLSELRNNRIDDPDTQSRMEALSAELDRLGTEHLSLIERSLTDALKSAQTGLEQREDARDPESNEETQSDSDQAIERGLATAGKHQDQVIASLQRVLKDLSQWDDSRRFRNDIRQIQRDEKTLAEDTTRLLPETLTKEFHNLPPQLQAELKKNALRQKGLAGQLDRVLDRMDQMVLQLRQRDPNMAQTLADAVAEARHRALGGQMRNAAAGVEKNNVGQAARLQKKIAEDLEDVLDVLTDRKPTDLARLVQKLKEAEQDLERLRGEQARLESEIRGASQIADQARREQQLERLGRRQQEVQEQVDRFARRLMRLEAKKAGQLASKAGSQMGQAAGQSGAGQGEQAAQNAGGAKQDLDDAQQQLAAARRKAESELAYELAAKMKDQLQSLHDRQAKMSPESARLEGLRDPKGRLSAAQRATLDGLGRTQSLLKDETETVAGQLEQAEIFHLALSGAAQEMLRAIDLMAEGQTDKLTQQAQQNATRRFAQMLEALNPEPPPEDQQQPDQQQPGGGDGDQNQPPQDGIPELAQLKMLKLLQEELNLRTEQLETTFGQLAELSDEHRQQYQQLSREQGILADLVRNFIQPTDEAPENDPASLPDLREENRGGEDIQLPPELKLPGRQKPEPKPPQDIDPPNSPAGGPAANSNSSSTTTPEFTR